MVFSSTIFLAVFLPLVLFIYYVFLRPFRTAQNVFLLVASLGFYAWGEPWFVAVMMLSIVMNWLFGLMVNHYKESKRASHLTIVLTLIFNLTIIFIFKYLMFTVETVDSILGTNIKVPQIALPIGISFFTFQAISYVIDVYRGHGEVQKNPLNVGLYIAFFPQLIAGPIVRYETIADQIKNRKESLDQFSKGVSIFIAGLAKKMIIANNLAILADAAFGSETSELSMGMAWLGALAYSFQILFDFSGYSDMAIGLGKMFGFQFLKNFDYPYISGSVSEFWRRWHISLGSWFRDYVYIPLGGSRVKSKGRLVLNLFIVWALTGLWHGANWTFICWGLLYFVLLTVEKLTGLAKTKSFPVVRHIYTLFFVQMGWVFFRSETLSGAWKYLQVMFGAGQVSLWDSTTFFYLCEYGVFFLIAIFYSIPILPKLANMISGGKSLESNRLVGTLYPVVYVGLFLLCLAYMAKSSHNPFIYFNF